MSVSHLRPPGLRPEAVQTSSFDITIRFSASIPDLPLTVAANQNATTCTLKQLIREALPVDLKDRRIRLIHAGKALVDDALLSNTLKRTISHPPSRTATPGPYDEHDPSKSKGKGKEIVRDPPILNKIYIHCSIGDVVLSRDELSAEAKIASQASSQEHASQTSGQQTVHDESVTTPAPRGFDRLLAAGFTAAEVQSLRMSFMAIQAHTHTPDTMPSPDALRDLEDRWLDNSDGTDARSSNGFGTSTDDDAQAGSLDDMLWGAAMGFFWPVGCMFWGMREDGIWSQRRKMAVVVGVILNIGIGFMRYTE